MKNEKAEQESQQNPNEKGPIRKEDVPKNPDHKIDQDFPGYPHNPSRYEVVNPGSKVEKETSDVHEKDGEKRTADDGSGNAFDGTERVKE